MPYAYDPFLDEEKKDQEGNPQLAGGSQIVGGATQTSAAGGSANGPTSSDRFQNLNSYIDANQGNQFGENFAKKVQDDVSKGKEAQDQAGSAFKSQADQSTIAANPALVNTAVADPTKFVSDANNVAEFKKQRDAEYKGPNTFADSADIYSKTYGATKKATDVAGAGQTESGRFALLNNYFGRPEYNSGQKSLDNLLVTGDSKAMQGLDQARQNAQQLHQSFDAQNKDLSGYAAQARGTTEATRTGARDALGIDNAGNTVAGKGAIGAVKGSLDNRIGQYGSEIDRINAAMEKGDYKSIDPEIASLFSELGGNYGVQFNPYLNTKSKTALTDSTVSSPEEQAKMRALASLADIQNPLDNPDAGSLYGNKMYQLDAAGYKGKVGNEKKAFQAKKTEIDTDIQDAKNYEEFLRASIAKNGADSATQNGVNDTMRLEETKKRIQDLNKTLFDLHQQYGVTGYTQPAGGGITGGLR